MAEGAFFLTHSHLGRFVSLDLAFAALEKVLGPEVEDMIVEFAFSEEDSWSSICSDFLYGDVDGLVTFSVDTFFSD